MDTGAITELHEEFAFPGTLVTSEDGGRDPDTGRPISNETAYDVGIRIESNTKPTQRQNPSGNAVLADATIRLSEAELQELGAYPEEGDEIKDARAPPKGGKEYEIIDVNNYNTGVVECDCEKITDKER